MSGKLRGEHTESVFDRGQEVWTVWKSWNGWEKHRMFAAGISRILPNELTGEPEPWEQIGYGTTAIIRLRSDLMSEAEADLAVALKGVADDA